MLVVIVLLGAMVGCTAATSTAIFMENKRVQIVSVGAGGNFQAAGGSGQITTENLQVSGLDDICIGEVSYLLYYDTNNNGEFDDPANPPAPPGTPDLPPAVNTSFQGPAPISISGTTVSWNASMGPMRAKIVVTDCDGNVILDMDKILI